MLEGIGGPFLDNLGPEQLVLLSRGARRLSVKAGDVIFLDHDVRTGIIVSGITRTFLRGTRGRQLSVRYARRGALIGTVTGIHRKGARLTVQAVTACEIVQLDRSVFLGLAASDAVFGVVVLGELAERLQDVYGALAISTFGSIRERLVRQLLELAHGDLVFGRITVAVTQQALADGIGSAREVVARTLAELRREGLIETGKGTITLLDPQRLAAGVAGWADR